MEVDSAHWLMWLFFSRVMRGTIFVD